MEELVYTMIEQTVGYTFQDRALLEQALSKNNQSLAFVGDAVITTAIREYLVRKHPNEGVAFGSCMSRAVTNRLFAQVAREIGIADCVVPPTTVVIQLTTANVKKLGTAFEALTCAILWDGGYGQVREFLARFLMPKVKPVLREVLSDAMVLLKIVCQQHFGCPPHYKKITSRRASNRKDLHTVRVSVDGHFFARGIGRTIKAASVIAAENALAKLRKRGLVS